MSERLRRAEVREGLRRLAVDLVPDGVLQRARRLRGGLSCIAYVITVDTASGLRQRFVVRQYGAEAVSRNPRVAEHEAMALRMLSDSAVPVPRAVRVDRDGVFLGSPTLVTTVIAGRSWLRPKDMNEWLRHLAAALATIHRTPLEHSDMLACWHGTESATDVDRWKMEQSPTCAAVWAALQAHSSASEPDPVLVHGDFWPGNTMWRRERLTGVVDWEGVCIGPRGYDVGYCRLDLALSFGTEVADAFARAYALASNQDVDDLVYWDLVAAWRALPDPEKWLPAWQAFGLTELSAETVRSRLQTFVDNALHHKHVSLH